MHEFQDFVVNNLWLCLGVGVVLLVVGDEVLGITRNLLGDEEERRTEEAKAIYRQMEKEEEAEEDELLSPPSSDEPPGGRIEDLLTPKQ